MSDVTGWGSAAHACRRPPASRLQKYSAGISFSEAHTLHLKLRQQQGAQVSGAQRSGLILGAARGTQGWALSLYFTNKYG